MRYVRLWLLKNHAKSAKNKFSDPKISPKVCFRRRKTKHPESSETRFGKVSRRSEPCSRSYEKNFVTARTWLGFSQKVAKTRFWRFWTFRFSTPKKVFGENFGSEIPFFANLASFWTSHNRTDLKISFLVEFCSRLTYREVRTPKKSRIWRKSFGDPKFSLNPRLFGRADLSISQSRAKFDEEADFEVHSAVAPQK